MFCSRWLMIATFLVCAALNAGDIPRPADAPTPLSPEESAKLVTLPPGFRLELVASEPLINEPSGVAFDEEGRIFVTELHGYNVEGQIDVDELNKTGKLDREVRRIQADENAKKAAEKETYGTVKRLIDTDGDGKMDKAEVWADRLPPCYGLCPARGGVIVACAPDIVFLADRDHDGKAEVREVLFTGFNHGALERGINAPQWGLDDWIYVGGGHGGGTITGPHLKKSVKLPNSDFRIRADGSAIEPIVGKTHTYGFAFTEGGDRFTISTRTAGIYVAPFEERYLGRNPDVAIGSLDRDASSDVRVYPTSKPHPWRTRRAEDPGFSKFYSDRYGNEEAAPNGYFTSACSPLVYQDQSLPGLTGQLFACEPAQNIIHRAIIQRDGVVCKLKRPAEEASSEFLASADTWFHPMSLSHGPDGAIWIVDFYREIIEDYSAIPRYLQQQYGVVNGQDRGRVWRLVHDAMPNAPPVAMAALSGSELTKELTSTYSWRRRTAQRLLMERQLKNESPSLAALIRESNVVGTVLAALYSLDALGSLGSEDIVGALNHPEAEVRVHALRFADQRFQTETSLLEKVLSMTGDQDPRVVLQLALSLGNTSDPRAINALALLAQNHANEPFVTVAILSSLAGHGGDMLQSLLSDESKMGQAQGMLEPLGKAIAARRDAAEISSAICLIQKSTIDAARREFLKGLTSGFPTAIRLSLSEEAVASIQLLLASRNDEDRSLVRLLVARLGVESQASREARLTKAATQLRDIQEPATVRLAAVEELGAEDDPAVVKTLVDAFAINTPSIQEAILTTLMAKKDRLPAVLEALESKAIPAHVLSAVHRLALIEHPDDSMRERATKLFVNRSSGRDELHQKFLAGLKGKRDAARGEVVFREKCGTCHQAHGVGTAVGPDLSAEFQRAEETMIRDVVLPSETIAAGYSTCVVATVDGHVYSGLLISESVGSVTLRQPGGKEQSVLRKEIEELKTLPISLMPDDLATSVSPEDLASVITWLRKPSSSLTLFDDNVEFVTALKQGDGTATFITTDRFSGLGSLRVTPLQRQSPAIEGWSFKIREKPGPGEFRYIRFAWKSDGATGIMIELANGGRWPKASQAVGRYLVGENGTPWKATSIGRDVPVVWQVVVRDLWGDFGDMTLTGIAPTAVGGPALFDRFELRQTIPPEGVSHRTRRVLYNLDGDSCISTKAGGKGPVSLTSGDLVRLVEELCGKKSRVDTILLCINAQVMYYPTKVGTMRGAASNDGEKKLWPDSEKRRFSNIEEFFAKGIDPYAVILQEASKRGREAMISFRVNDDHGNEFLRTQFWIDHPEYRLSKGALNFGHPEVREYVFQLIVEAVRRYDSDGLELDFNRFPTFFAKGTQEERVAAMNELVKRVRQLLDEVGHHRGKRLALGVRVPTDYGRQVPSPKIAMAQGCDVAEWSRQGWIDYLVVSEFLFERDELPIKPWREMVQGIPIYGGIEPTKGGSKKDYLSANDFRMAATSRVREGADGIYLFNFFTTREYGAESWEPPFEVLDDLGIKAKSPPINP